MVDALRDEVALIGVAGHAEAATIAARGLAALAHRGGDAAGLVVGDGSRFRGYWPGRARDLDDPITLGELRGTVAIGKVWTSSRRRVADRARRPICATTQLGPVAAGLSGRLLNGAQLVQGVTERGAVHAEGTPEELLIHLAAQSGQERVVNRLVDALWRLEGAFAALLATTDTLMAVRDPRGFKPLVLGRLDGAVIFATEDVAIRAVGGEVLREVEPGEMVLADPSGVKTTRPFRPVGAVRCMQEAVQLARLGATVTERSVWQIRHELGRRLAKEGSTQADVVVPVHGDDTPAAVGFAEAADLPWARGVLVAPGALASDGGAAPEGWFAVPDVLAGQRVVLVTHTLGTGRSLKAVVSAVHSAGAKEVHLRLVTPPLRRSCPYGVVGPATDALASQQGRVGAAHLAVETMRWLAREHLHEVIRPEGDQGMCDACLTGDLPLEGPKEGQLGLFGGVERR